MKGSIRTRTRANGAKAYDALYRSPSGAQKGRTFSRRKDAERFLAETVVAVTTGAYRDLTPITFQAFALEWLKGLGNLKPSTARCYRSVVTRHLIPVFGPQPLHTLDVEAVNRYLAARAAKGRRPKTVNNELQVLSKILGDAKEAGHLVIHPLTGSRALRRPRALHAEDTVEVEVFDPSEVNALLDAVDPWYTDHVLVGVSCGLRPGELAGLYWGDLDERARVLHIRRTWDGREGRDLVLKTRGSRRSVDIGDQVLAALRRRRQERFGDEPVDPEAAIFVTPTGTRIEVGNFRKNIWVPALLKAGLAYRKPYALRHTFASLQLAQGQSVRYVSEQLGHASPVMTLNVYARYLPRERREAPAKFEATLRAAREEAIPDDRTTRRPSDSLHTR